MDEHLKAYTQELLMKTCTRTRQGVVLKPGSLHSPNFDVVSTDEVSTSIKKQIASTVDSSFVTLNNKLDASIESRFDDNPILYPKIKPLPVLASLISPHIPNVYNDPNRGYPPDTRYGQYNYIVPQPQPIRPPIPPPNQHGSGNMEELISGIIRDKFRIEARNCARVYLFTPTKLKNGRPISSFCLFL
uniref:Uncharacterized protein n=1 Tax=Oryza barthii TaxID=65489 RepID=A0A0D3EY99_9ORYZ